MTAGRHRVTPSRFLVLVTAVCVAAAGSCAAPADDSLGAERVPPACAGDGARVLFIGNSYTFGSTSALRYFRAETVEDLYQTDFGGVPALVGLFADQAGVDLDVSHATSSGFGLHDHVGAGLERFDRPWDCVVLQSLSMLDRQAPGDPQRLVEASAVLAEAVRARNDAAQILFFATWPRADYVHLDGRPWSGQGLARMTADIRAGYERAAGRVGADDAIIPVGDAWLEAIQAGLAVENPYQGVPYGQVSLWSYDQHHASPYGSYLSALVIFARLTGLDPRSLGETELAAWELGIEPGLAAGLQAAAREAVGDRDLTAFSPVPGSQYRPGRRGFAPQDASTPG
jgi:hypothetical protein